MRYGMTRCGRERELGNDIQRIARRNRAHGEVAVDGLHLLACACPVTAQTVFVLIDGWSQNACAVSGADSGNVRLRDADQRRGWEYAHNLRSVTAVAIHARGMTIVVEQHIFFRVMRAG